MSAVLDEIAERLPDALKADGFDDAIIGVAHRAGGMEVIAYDIEKCLKVLRDRDGMSHEEAQEFFDFNVVAAWMGDQTPVFIERMDNACPISVAAGAYSEVLDASKQKRFRFSHSYAYRYKWLAPQSLMDRGFSALHAVLTIPNMGSLGPSAVISPGEVWFESKQRFPYGTRLFVTY
jgi:hypothetical protein